MRSDHLQYSVQNTTPVNAHSMVTVLHNRFSGIVKSVGRSQSVNPPYAQKEVSSLQQNCRVLEKSNKVTQEDEDEDL